MSGTRLSHFNDIERDLLKPLPTRILEVSEFKLVIVNINYHVEVAKHNYSVPCSLVKKKVEIRFTSTTVEILHEGKRVASRIRSFKEGAYTTVDTSSSP